MAFTEENVLLIFMCRPYLFCAGLLSRSENLNYLRCKDSHTMLYLTAVSGALQAGSLQKYSLVSQKPEMLMTGVGVP